MDCAKESNKLPDIKFSDNRKSLPPAIAQNPTNQVSALLSQNTFEITDSNLNNAFYEAKTKPVIDLQPKRSSVVRYEDIWKESVLDWEKKKKLEEAKQANDRLKMIVKKTYYPEREILSPSSRAKIEAVTTRSSSRKETIPKIDEESAKKRILPRSLSKKDKNLKNLRGSSRSPSHILSFPVIQGKCS